MADVGTGASIAFATSAFAAEILAINGSDISRAVINTSHLGTTGSHTKMSGDLVDEGEVELEIQFDPNKRPPIDAAPEQITITFPLPVGGVLPAKFVGSGFISSWSWGAALEEKMTASATITWAGAVTETNST